MRTPIICGGILWLLAVTTAASNGQQKQADRVFIDERPSEPNRLACIKGTNFEVDQYTIRNVSVVDPFSFLHWIDRKRDGLQRQLSGKLANQPFRYLQVDSKAFWLIDKSQFVPATKGSFAISVYLLSVTNCNTAAKTLDLNYAVYSMAPLVPSAGTAESQAEVKSSPQVASGLDRVGSRFHLVPAGGYNRSYDLFAGGKLEYLPGQRKLPLLDSLTVEGQGSASIYQVSAALAEATSFTGWVRHVSWQLNSNNTSIPAGPTRLAQGLISGQIDAQTKAFLRNSLAARAGVLLEGGHLQSTPLPGSHFAPGIIASSGYGSVKSYFGLSSRLQRNVMSLSYGLEVGSVGPYSEVGWLKHIGDVEDDWWTPAVDHKSFEVESRLTFGALQVTQKAPLATRFFAGNAEHFFIPGNAWQIRDVPVIRAIPANRFNATAQGTGADRFAGLNLTLSYPVKVYPIVPEQLTKDKEFNDLLQGQLVTATNTVQSYFAWKDKNFATTLSTVTQLQKDLEAMETTLDAAIAVQPDQPAADTCDDTLGDAIFYASDAFQAKNEGKYKALLDLTPAGDAKALQKVQASCVPGSAPALSGPAFRAASDAVFCPKAATKKTCSAAKLKDGSADLFLQQFNTIDRDAADEKAKNEMAFVDRMVNTVLKECNILSIAPVGVFDAVSLGPHQGDLGGARTGPGGGVRFELASSVNFTLGYAWNVNHKPGEGDGALFFSIGTRDLFH